MVEGEGEGWLKGGKRWLKGGEKWLKGWRRVVEEVEEGG